VYVNKRRSERPNSFIQKVSFGRILSKYLHFQVMEGDKEAYLEEVSKALRRQRKTISDLDDEKRQLERSIKVSRLENQNGNTIFDAILSAN
jgi:hypothetical protein